MLTQRLHGRARGDGALVRLLAVVHAGLIVAVTLTGCPPSPHDQDRQKIPRSAACPAGTTKCCYVDNSCYCYPSKSCMTCQWGSLPQIPTGTWRACDPDQCEVCVDGACKSTCNHCQACWRGQCQDACSPHCQVCGFDATQGREACISTCTACQTCSGGSCRDACSKAKCQACGLNTASGRAECISTCGPNQQCKAGQCVSEAATYCPCNGKNYESESQCDVGCPGGIACFGTRCQVPPVK